MNTTNNQPPEKNGLNKFPAIDELIDLIANLLPAELREGYYRHMLYFKSLPQEDEMMRLLHAMQYLTILTERVPGRIAEQYGLFDRICTIFIERAKELAESGKDCYKNIYKHLVEHQENILKGLDPKAFVAQINDVLIKQFHNTTIPTTARQLAENAKAVEVATAQHKKASEELCSTWNSTTKEAREAIGEIKMEVLRSVTSLENAKDKLEFRFDAIFSRTSMLIGAMLFVLGLLIGIAAMIPRNLQSKMIDTETTTVQTIQPQPPIANPAQKKNR